MIRRIVLGIVVAGVAGHAALSAQQPVKDHPLVSRFQGSEVQEHKTSDFDSFVFPLGMALDHDKFVKMETLEGKVTKFKYSVPAGKSGLEIARSYQNALQKAGFQILYTCDGKTGCFSPKFPFGSNVMASGMWCYNCTESTRYVGAKLSRPTGDAYVTVVVNVDSYAGGTWLSVIEPKPMAAGTVSVNAAAMANDISTAGHASIYGIHFDTGKATLKPESDGTLAEIGKLLASNPQLKLHVIGHTDNVGVAAANLALSKQRAEAVVAALTAKHKVAPARVQAAGVGSLAPVATNRTEDGRARNRRVELVEQ
jgi:OOP family OmpA-OmpF porin